MNTRIKSALLLLLAMVLTGCMGLPLTPQTEKGMDEIYNKFCEVQFLCYQGEPNWLGWLILGLACLIVVFIIFYGMRLQSEEELEKSGANKDSLFGATRMTDLQICVWFTLFLLFISLILF